VVVNNLSIGVLYRSVLSLDRQQEANGCVRGCLTNDPFYAVVFKPLEHLACEGECEAIYVITTFCI